MEDWIMLAFGAGSVFVIWLLCENKALRAEVKRLKNELERERNGLWFFQEEHIKELKCLISRYEAKFVPNACAATSRAQEEG